MLGHANTSLFKEVPFQKTKMLRGQRRQGEEGVGFKCCTGSPNPAFQKILPSQAMTLKPSLLNARVRVEQRKKKKETSHLSGKP
jgi:hypothetical protein